MYVAKKFLFRTLSMMQKCKSTFCSFHKYLGAVKTPPDDAFYVIRQTFADK